MTFKVFFRKLKNAPITISRRTKLAFLWWLAQVAMRCPLNEIFKGMPAAIWKFIGIKMGKDVCFGYDVYLDVNYADQVTIEDDVWIASKVVLFAHRREMHQYYKYGRYKECPQKKRPVCIKKGVCIGIGAMIMPGVTIGEGACVGAGALVVKDVPAWSLVAGCPAKVIRYLQTKEEAENENNKNDN